METQNGISIEIRIHYFFANNDIHQMDAKIHNECETQLLRAIDVLKTYIGDFRINVLAKNQGSLIESFVIPYLKDPFVTCVNSFINRFFSKQKTDLSLTEDRLNLLSKIKEKIKNGDISAKEAEIISSDPKISKCISETYKTLKDSPVNKIIAQTKLSNKELPSLETEISRSEFDSQIIETKTIEQTTETYNTTVGILAPVLQEGHGNRWRGFYSGSTIDFKIEDDDFLKQVYNNEIKFGANTTITCTLVITTKEIYENDIKISEDKISYIVKDVTQWADDETFKFYSKKYKKINNNSANYGKQLEIEF